jgi:uncharacterized lipoprotein YajG
MKKLLTLTVMLAGVALFAGCLNKPATDDATTTGTVETTTTEVTMPTVEEVVPTTEVTTTGTVETTTTETTTPTAE